MFWVHFFSTDRFIAMLTHFMIDSWIAFKIYASTQWEKFYLLDKYLPKMLLII